MIPYTFNHGEPPRKTYKDFQQFESPDREAAITWLNGETRRVMIVKRLIDDNRAANDNISQAAATLVSYQEYVMMLYCWIENGRDDVRAKLAFVEGRLYGPE